MISGISRSLVIWTLLIAIPAVVACAFSYTIFRSQLTDIAAKNLLFLHKSELAQIQSTVHNVLIDMHKLSNTPLLQAVVDAHLLSTLSTKAPQSFEADAALGLIDLKLEQPLQGISDLLLKQSLSNAPYLTSITIVGKLGDILGQSGGATWPVKSLDNQLPTKLGKQAQINHVWKNLNGSTIAGITAPILNQSRRNVGYLRIEIAIDSIMDSLKIYKELGDSAEAFLITRNGTQTSILSSDGLASADDVIASLPVRYTSVAERSSGLQANEIISLEKHPGIETITAIGVIAETQWTLIFNINKSDVIAPFKKVGVVLIFAAISTLFITLLVTLLAVRPLMRRIKGISTASDNFSNRKFDFSINDKKSDEIGVLSFHIDNIAAELASKTNIQVAVREQLHYRDTHDEITGLLKRSSLMQILSDMETVSDKKTICALAIDFRFDLDPKPQHENINEYVTLANLCKKLEDVLPLNAHAALWNKSMIMVLLNETDSDSVATLKQSISKWLQMQHKDGEPTNISLRYGSASVHDTDSVDDLFRHAIEEITLQKNNDAHKSNAYLESALLVETAIKENRIEVWYQPVVELTDNNTPILISAEAMVRIRCESGEVHLAEEFILHIQDHPAGLHLDKTVVSLVTKAAAAWKEKNSFNENFSISINLTRRSITSLDMMEHIIAESAINEIDMQSLILEVPPSSMVEQLDKLMLYKSMGARFAIDDISIQNFSFSQLKSLQPELVKINWANISKKSDSSDALTAKHFLNLLGFFRSIGTDIVAKNIENHGQSIAMSKHGIRQMQGYQFGAATDLHSFIEQSNRYAKAEKQFAKRSA